MKHLESSESTRRKSQNDRPSSVIPQESRANLRVPSEFLMLRVAQFVLKIVNLAISMDPDYGSWRLLILLNKLLTRNKTFIFLHVQFSKSVNVIVTAQLAFSIQTFFVSEKVLHGRIKYYDKLITVVFSTEFGC